MIALHFKEIETFRRKLATWKASEIEIRSSWVPKFYI